MHHFPNASPLFYRSRNYTAPKEVSLRDKKVSPEVSLLPWKARRPYKTTTEQVENCKLGVHSPESKRTPALL